MKHIRSKILLITVGGLLFTSVVSTIAINLITRSSLEQRTTERVQAELERAADAVLQAILAGDQLALRDVVQRTIENRADLMYMFVLAADGRVLASSFLDGVPRDLYDVNRLVPGQRWHMRMLSTERGRVLDVAHGVLRGQAGEIHLGVRGAALTAIAEQAVHTLVIIQIGSLALAILASFVLAQIIVRPIHRLVDVVRRVGAGDLAVTVGIDSDDEVGRLARAFNAMLRELRRSQRELRDLAARSQAIVASFPNALFVTDGQGRIESSNPAAHALTGMGEHELHRATLGDLFVYGPDQRPVDDLVATLRPDGTTHSYAMALRRGDGKAIPVAFNAAPMRLPDGQLRGFVVETRDLSRLQSAIDGLKQQQALLAESTVDLDSLATARAPSDPNTPMSTYLVRSDRLASLGQLAASVAHELNNPLFSILTCASILERDLAVADDEDDHVDERTKRLLQTVHTIHAESVRCSEVVRGFLDYSRIGVACEDLVDLRDVLEAVRTLVEVQARPAHVEVAFDLEAGYAVRGDSNQLHQLFMNLALNAVQAMPNGGRLHVTVGPSDDRVCVTLADTGDGMSADQLRRAFEPFYTTKPKGVGTGLGLAVALGVTKSHGGSIEIQSAVGRGTTVTVHLPAASVGDEVSS